MYFAPSVLKTLFHINFDVVRSGVRVDNSPGYLIKFPPAVMRIQWGFAFCGQKSTTTCAYVTFLVFWDAGNLVIREEVATL
jgi:hypothetical protein